MGRYIKGEKEYEPEVDLDSLKPYVGKVHMDFEKIVKGFVKDDGFPVSELQTTDSGVYEIQRKYEYYGETGGTVDFRVTLTEGSLERGIAYPRILIEVTMDGSSELWGKGADLPEEIRKYFEQENIEIDPLNDVITKHGFKHCVKTGVSELDESLNWLPEPESD